MKKYICPYCNKEVSYHLRDEVIEEYKGKKVEVKVNIAVCDECKNDIFVPSIEDENLKRLYDKYREVVNYILPSDIVSFRKKYNVSQRELVSILNWGKMTINRYERGALPNQSHNDILKMIATNETFFKEKVEEAYNDGRINLKSYNKIIEKLKDSQKSLKRAILDFNLNHDESIFNGYRKFDFDRLENLISYISSKVENLYQTSLNKYLWFIDFEGFKDLIRSVTGIRYIKFDHGPIIEEFAYKDIVNYPSDKYYTEETESLYDNSVSIRILSKNNFDMSCFNEDEMEIINGVIDKLRDLKCNEISKLSHKEKGWIDTQSRQLISYEYADDLILQI